MDNSNIELKENLKKSYEDFWTQLLLYMEIVFPHEKGSGSENELRYNLIRSRVLRVGNDKVRNLDTLLDQYSVFKIMDLKVIENEDMKAKVIDFSNKWKINSLKKGGL